MTERNVGLLYGLADHFEANPNTWNQATWGGRGECGTFACLAGWGAILTYGDAVFVAPQFRGGMPEVAQFFDEHGPLPRNADVMPLHAEHIQDRMGSVFGLDQGEDEPEMLFSESWLPADGDLPKALRRLAEGASVEDVTDPTLTWDGDEWVDDDDD